MFAARARWAPVLPAAMVVGMMSAGFVLTRRGFGMDPVHQSKTDPRNHESNMDHRVPEELLGRIFFQIQKYAQQVDP